MRNLLDLAFVFLFTALDSVFALGARFFLSLGEF